jgi:hypothetical protein
MDFPSIFIFCENFVYFVVSNSNNYTKDYPTVESSFENVLQLLAALPPYGLDLTTEALNQEEEKLRGYQKLAGNPYIKILPKDTPGYSKLNRAYFQEIGKKIEDVTVELVNRPGESYTYKDYGEDLPDTAYVFEHLLKEDLLAELPHGIQYEYARRQNRYKSSQGFLKGWYEKFRKKYFPTAHDEINDILEEYQGQKTIEELHTQIRKDKKKFGEDVYGMEGKFEWVAHNLLEEILKKDLGNYTK